MNWMTSGRKRVQRSQKAKELRAKHFSKVAADRARAPLSQQVRAGGISTLRQSADVSRLKARWTQQQTSMQASFPQTSRRTAPSSTSAAAEGVDAAGTSPASAATPVGPGTTPETGSLPAGMLELDVTPPFNAAPRRQQYGSGGLRGSAGAGPTAGRLARETASQLYREQELAAECPRIPALHAEPAASSSSRLTLPLERRQLVFGMECAADRPGGVGEGYEGQLLGGEGDSDRRTGAVPAEIQHATGAVAMGVGAGGVPRAASQSGLFGQEWGRPMRFFDAGVEVAHDGSPMASAVTAPSPPTQLARFSAGRLGFPASTRDDDANEAGAPFGVTGSGEVCGLPSFSVGGVPGRGERPPSTPPEVWAEDLPADMHIDSFGSNSSSASNHEQPHSSHDAAADPHLYGHDQPGYAPDEDGCEPLGARDAHREEDHVPLEQECGGDLSQDAAAPVSAELSVLARTWGLFGGALGSPQEPAAVTATSSTPPAFGNDGADARGAAGEKAGEGHDEPQSTPRLHASIPVRATPHVTGLRSRQTQVSEPEATGERTPPPPALTAGDDDEDPASDDGSRSPELTMLFVDEPEGDVPQAAVAGHAGTEGLEGKRRASSESTTTAPASPPPSDPLASNGSPDPPAQQTTPADSSKQASAAAAATEGTPRQDKKTNHHAADGTLPADKPLNSNADGRGPAEATPQLTTAGDADLAKEDRPLGRRGPGGGGGSDKAPIDAVNADVPGSRGGRDREGVQVAGGGGSQPSRLPLSTAPPVVSGAADHVDAEQASSTAAAAGATGTRSAGRSNNTIAAAEEDSDAAEEGCPVQSSQESARSSVSSRPEAASSRTPFKAAGASSSSPSPERAVVVVVPPPSSERHSRKRSRQDEEEAQETTQGKRRRRKELSVPIATAAVEDRGPSAGRSSKSGSGGRGGKGGGRGGGLALKAAAEGHGRDGAGLGPEGTGVGGSRSEGDAYSTIVWYRTVVACLTAASS